MLGFAIVLVLSSSLLGCSGGRKNPLTLDEFKELFTTIEGELIELGEDTRTDKASAILLGRIHDMSITYYQMETEEDASELYTNISEELDKIKSEMSGNKTSVKGSSQHYLHNADWCYYVVKDSNSVIYGIGDEEWKELRYLMYKLGYYKYDETYVKNQKEVARQTYGY